MNRKQRDKNRQNAAMLKWHRIETNPKPEDLCSNCGKPGPHFVPPCFGDEGFYMCDRFEKHSQYGNIGLQTLILSRLIKSK
jgi:hypothetical protein